jgi:hypothetical protein
LSAAYRQLVERIRGGVEDLDRVVIRVEKAWTRAADDASGQELFVDSVALNLHAFYSGIERLFELIARHVDGELPSGEMWHRDLLRKMARDEGEVRPAVVGEETSSSLDEYRRFRHLIRNVYSFELLPEKIQPLVESLPSLWAQLRSELLAFASFLAVHMEGDRD